MKSPNATASAFGWDFQSNAAIMLMLKNIERASKVKVEGNTEDIEITLDDGKMLMSQVKAVVDSDDTSHVKEKLEAGLRTLNNAAQLSDVGQLFFVTNSPNPFNDVNTMYPFSSPLNTLSYAELPATCRKIITDICSSKGYDFDTAKLSICVMQFHGENDDERYKVLTSLTSEFLNKIGANNRDAYKISTSNLLTLWQHSFAVNATQLTTYISKKRMVWPVIAILCEVGGEDAALEEYDACDISEILQKYRNVINNNSERFEFVSRVLSDYNDFYPAMKSKERVKRFIEENWQNYKDNFDLKSADAEIEETVVRITLTNVLRSRQVIAKIKSKVKL